MSWAIPMKLPTGECHKTSFTISQHWFRFSRPCCHQTTSHLLSHCWPRSVLPYGVARLEWVNFSLQNCWRNGKKWTKGHTARYAKNAGPQGIDTSFWWLSPRLRLIDCISKWQWQTIQTSGNPPVLGPRPVKTVEDRWKPLLCRSFCLVKKLL